MLEEASQALLAGQAGDGLPAAYRPVAAMLNDYQAARGYVVEHWLGPIARRLLALVAIGPLFVAFRELLVTSGDCVSVSAARREAHK